jgi:hypothetical protein
MLEQVQPQKTTLTKIAANAESANRLNVNDLMNTPLPTTISSD